MTRLTMENLARHDGTFIEPLTSSTNSPTSTRNSPYPTRKLSIEFLDAQKTKCLSLLQNSLLTPRELETFSCATIYYISRNDTPLSIQTITLQTAETICATFLDNGNFSERVLIDQTGNFTISNAISLADAI